jgi:hypothetical protein
MPQGSLWTRSFGSLQKKRAAEPTHDAIGKIGGVEPSKTGQGTAQHIQIEVHPVLAYFLNSIIAEAMKRLGYKWYSSFRFVLHEPGVGLYESSENREVRRCRYW